MATLSDAQLARIRRQSGDAMLPYELSDADIQAIYDDTDTGNSSLDRSTYYVIRDRMALAASQVDSLSDSGTGMSRSMGQKFNNLRKMLADWADIAEIAPTPSLPGLTVGLIGLRIDASCDDENGTYWPW